MIQFLKLLRGPSQPVAEASPKMSHCLKCGTSFVLFPPQVKYARDVEWGERLLWSCARCGFKWTGPIEDQKL